MATIGGLTADLLTLTGGEGDVTHGGHQMAYTLAAVSYGSGKINGTHHEREAEPAKLHLVEIIRDIATDIAPPTAPLALAEARVSQVEAELRLMLVEAQVSHREERLSHLEAELAACARMQR
jgi:hypothetical protein